MACKGEETQGHWSGSKFLKGLWDRCLKSVRTACKDFRSRNCQAPLNPSMLVPQMSLNRLPRNLRSGLEQAESPCNHSIHY
mmetsp:Transcript_40797/g.73422  ORF Transcript_40797/g.73422 Transcript_40797/m.73422 type:complete len:81 (+) Transcript_40797:117-359(+)